MAERIYPSLPDIYTGETFDQAAFGETPALHPSLKQLAMLAVRYTRTIPGKMDEPWTITHLVEPWIETIEDETLVDDKARTLLDPNIARRQKFLARLFPDTQFDDPDYPDIASSAVAYARFADIASWRKRRLMRPYAGFALQGIGPWESEELHATLGTTNHISDSFFYKLADAVSQTQRATGELIIAKSIPLEQLEAAIPAFANLQRKDQKKRKHDPSLPPLKVRREAMFNSIEDANAHARTPFERLESVMYTDVDKKVVAPWFGLLEGIADGKWDMHRANVIVKKTTGIEHTFQADDTQHLTWFLAELIFWYSHTGNKISSSGSFYTSTDSVDNKIASLLAYIQNYKLATISAAYCDNAVLPTVNSRIYGVADTGRFFEPRLTRALQDHPQDDSSRYKPSNLQPTVRSNRQHTHLPVSNSRSPSAPIHDTVNKSPSKATPPTGAAAIEHLSSDPSFSSALPQDIARTLRAAYEAYPRLLLSERERDLAKRIFGSQDGDRLIVGRSIDQLHRLRGRDTTHARLLKEVTELIEKLEER